MFFKRSVQRYGRTPLPDTPFARAGQLWDDRIGSARVQARNWRLMAFGCLALAAGSSAALGWQSLQSRVTPYVVEVDKLGEARAISVAETGFRPTDPQIAWHLSKFIRNIRSVSLDPVLMRRDWLEAYDFTTPRGGNFLSQHARSTSPFANVGARTVSVQVTSVVRASDTSFQVKWAETAFERGAAVGSSRWTAILTIATRAPASADVLRKNPLGIYVDAIDWSRELEPSPTMPAQPGLRGWPADLPLGSPLDPEIGTLSATPSASANEEIER